MPRRARGQRHMDDKELFTLVGMSPQKEQETVVKSRWYKGKPIVSMVVLGAILLGCIFCDFFVVKDPAYLDLANCNHPPDSEFLFGTDSLGRDVFSMIWYGGRVSLFIGFLAAVISVAIAIIFGSVSGMASRLTDGIMMRFTEILLSVPSLLIIIFIQAVLGKANVLSIAFVIGITGWTAIAKVVRTEVRQIRGSGYVVASKAFGGGFFHILRQHLAPNFISSIMFMAVMSINSAIVAESTLSFMGIGLPVETVSWGSMLSLAEKALLTNSWWVIFISGGFLVVTLLCVTNIGNYLRQSANKKESNI